MANQESIAARLEAAIDSLSKSIAPLNSKDRVCIICEQIIVLRAIVAELEGGGANG